MPRPRAKSLTYGSVTSQVVVLVALSAVMGVLVAGLVIPFAGALGFGTKAVSKSMKNFPIKVAPEPLAQRTRLLDAHGHLIATFYDQNRVYVPLDKIAPIMRKAVVDIEDARFYQHGALDVKGTIRAFLKNQASSGVTQGGSSITQQLAKMTQLNQAKNKKEQEAATADTYKRKLQELRLAVAFEKNYSKDWILERYLNIAYFGDGTYGIQSASRHYFSKDASELTTAEAALLGGLVKNPVGYDPTTFPDRALSRRNTVLNRMAAAGDISQAEADQLAATDLGLKVSPSRNGCLGSKAAFFCDYVRRYLLADPSLGKTVQDRQTLLNSGGLTIKTTLDLRFQEAADRATAAHVKPTDQAIGALAMVEPGTGDVRAISQSRPMGRKKKKGETFLNYVVDSKYGDSNGFQAGSTFKLFTLAAALEQGLPTSTRFNSPQTMHIPQNEYQTCDGPYPNTAPWDVNNSTGTGNFDMYKGMQQSVNTYFAQLEKKTGLCKPFQLAKAMGVDLGSPATEMVPSFTLGVADVSPLEMAGAYATVAARGLHCDNRPVTRILNADGRVFKTYAKKCQQVMQQNTADTINDILKGVMAPGGFGAGLVLDKPSAGKTGTRSENKAVWFDGYTPALATASMIAGANQDGQPITLNGQTVGGAYIATAHGSTTAGPMWADAMRAIQDLLPDLNFVTPIKIQSSPNLTVVPNVVGMTPQDAQKTLQDAGFTVTTVGQAYSDVPVGLVAQTSPAGGSTTYAGSTISLYTSAGPAPVAPPATQTPPGGTTQPSPGPGNGNGNGHGPGPGH
ncbi:penicillin-binding protein [Nocardioides pocheonensis]|uniref:Penicillin-binding protein n=1 Tax=Nocardioides pocheonensis TaxID=661485 RepID=A0A3N0GRC2_9ACTN|nr:transglycosylase domain-containing protein [Nocardioides pocheonensis]RNM14650.1 penicillin-binding protein [Nocardioides pocheonensis]